VVIALEHSRPLIRARDIVAFVVVVIIDVMALQPLVGPWLRFRFPYPTSSPQISYDGGCAVGIILLNTKANAGNICRLSVLKRVQTIHVSDLLTDTYRNVITFQISICRVFWTLYFP
jgi:hypothetical protein